MNSLVTKTFICNQAVLERDRRQAATQRAWSRRRNRLRLSVLRDMVGPVIRASGRGDLIAPASLVSRSSMESSVHLIEPSSPCSCGPAFEDGPGETYNEAAFRYLLQTERQRADRAGRPVVLLLVHLGNGEGSRSRIALSTGSKLLSGLSVSVRDVDFVGWYRERRIAGAVLTQGPALLTAAACRELQERVTRVLASELPAHLSGNVHVRVRQLQPKQNTYLRRAI